MKEYVVGFAFDPGETMVALIRKNRPAWQRGRLNGIGGKVEKHEAPLAAMAREFREEAGVNVEWQLFATLEGRDDFARVRDAEPFRVWFFRGVTGEAGFLSLTDEKVAWAPTFNLPADALPNLHWLVPMAKSSQAHDWPFRVAERAHEARELLHEGHR